MSDNRQTSVLVLGDIMVTREIRGTASLHHLRAFPVLDVKDTIDAPGGAAKTAVNLAALGTYVTLAGLIGPDDEGILIKTKMTESGVDTKGVIFTHDRPTARMTHIVDSNKSNQPLLRIDRDNTAPVSVRAERDLLQVVVPLLGAVDSIVLVDCGQGFFASTVAKKIIELANADNKPVIISPKRCGSFHQYSGATAIVPNLLSMETALGVHTPFTRLPDWEIYLDHRARTIRDGIQVGALVVPCGLRGVRIYEDRGKTVIKPTPLAAIDLNGAENSFLAAFVWVLSKGESIAEAAQKGNLAHGIACSKPGCQIIRLEDMVLGSERVKEWNEEHNTNTSSKILSPEVLRRKIWCAKAAKQRLVLATGIFDLLHGGHIDFLQKAKALGDRLVIGLRSDASAQRLEGPGRPVVPETQRAQVLSALACVDYVVLFDMPTPQVIELIRPHVLVSGENPAEVVGCDTVRAHGGRVEMIPRTAGISTTTLVESIVQRHSI
ncbi:uncharacterized protein N7515_004499 [Penicillium bovifimosum]|uniref:D-glycero-beta-D-manno-heptose 1-phosphate adenylyltransferase n=1 Tax=Penicillium bovifimosum TaxID=126998 RepID=A0A9W9H082_9EURO|nr:uncharacterized protein N7515_004499 [Penicillium bovifimosum]KAJ5135221.1 hypothetical protein N7515_004499 [Penicillium bovifimosum]